MNESIKKELASLALGTLLYFFWKYDASWGR